jgi:MarR family transcriptional regulator for hemolysin
MASAEPLAASPRRTIESTFMATSREMRRAYDSRLAGLGLKLSEAFLLAHVHTRGPLTQTQAAELLGIGRAATGALIDALERKGLVERSGHAGDRRVWLLSSTARAAAIVEEIIALDAALRQEMWTGISQAERRTLHQILGRLQTNLAAVLHEQT